MAVDAGPVSDVDADATELLCNRGISVKAIVRVDPDAILYRGSGDRAMMAWLGRDSSGNVTVAYESGFPAFPSDGLVPRHLLSREAAQHDMDQA